MSDGFRAASLQLTHVSTPGQIPRNLARESSVRDLTNGQSELYYDPKATRGTSD
jgi:hypothetical protein